MRLIDLSQDIYEGMKVYPGHLKTVQFEHATHEETAPRFEGGFSFQTTGFMLNDNGPTHVDSFSHLDPDPSADTIEKMPLDLFHVAVWKSTMSPALTSTGAAATTRSRSSAVMSVCGLNSVTSRHTAVP